MVVRRGAAHARRGLRGLRLGCWPTKMSSSMEGRWRLWESASGRRPCRELPRDWVRSLSFSPCRHLPDACVPSSKVGFVNVYGSDAASGSVDRPKALKSLGNLTTSITSLRFNHDAQLLAIASNVKKDQMRLVRTLGLAPSHDIHISTPRRSISPR